MESYRQLTTRQSAEAKEFPLFFAYTQKQFDEGMKKLGLDPSDSQLVCQTGLGNCCFRKTDAPKFHDMLARHGKELFLALQDEEFAIEAMIYELLNHEYCITRAVGPALEALGLTLEDARKDKRIAHALTRAIEKIGGA